MKGISLLVLRLLPFVLFITLGVYIVLSCVGIDIYVLNLLHSHSIIYALAIYLVQRSDKKNFCSYHRCMTLFLIFTPLFNFFDEIFGLFNNIDNYLYFIVSAYVAFAVTTAYLAIKHFYRVKRLKRIRSNEQ